MASSSLWQRFQRYLLEYRQLGFSLDVSRAKFSDDLLERMQPQIERAFSAMRELEAGAIANPTERRIVGRYWLRSPALAPTPQIRSEIEDTIGRIKAFAEDAHAGKIQKRVREELSGESETAEAIARSGDTDREDVLHLLRHLASNGARIKVTASDEPADDRFSLEEPR